MTYDSEGEEVQKDFLQDDFQKPSEGLTNEDMHAYFIYVLYLIKNGIRIMTHYMSRSPGRWEPDFSKM